MNRAKHIHCAISPPPSGFNPTMFTCEKRDATGSYLVGKVPEAWAPTRSFVHPVHPSHIGSSLDSKKIDLYDVDNARSWKKLTKCQPPFRK